MPSRIFLIRHGQSTFNALYEIDGVDPMHFDARLSALGLEQVEQAREAAAALGVDLVVVSPLTRAIQTGPGTLRHVGGSDRREPFAAGAPALQL